ncbi:MAG: branched-chain amino acid ABC transporter substrate-binding protein [Terracidiphilus sp.]|nr:branched-chain amino acid ABC transporter substrate-binding protein [Terracidiphilus sp.]
MFAGATWPWWIGFHVAVLVLLVVDALLPSHRRDAGVTRKVAWIWTGVLLVVVAAFATWLWLAQGRELALEWVAGYTIETSLSVDNLFVFLVIFQGFRVSERRQHTALLWGVGGAIVLRGIFIAAGVTLMAHFEWVTWVFGVVLLYAAIRLARGSSTHDAVPGWVKNIHPARGSLIPVIVAVELTDLLFAVDSIPAVLAVSRNPFVVYTSNIAAILGLRSLYFALASLLTRFRYLHYGLAALLGFVALKMLADPWLDVPVTVSLAVIGGILAVCAVVALFVREKAPAAGGH